MRSIIFACAAAVALAACGFGGPPDSLAFIDNPDDSFNYEEPANIAASFAGSTQPITGNVIVQLDPFAVDALVAPLAGPDAWQAVGNTYFGLPCPSIDLALYPSEGTEVYAYDDFGANVAFDVLNRSSFQASSLDPEFSAGFFECVFPFYLDGDFGETEYLSIEVAGTSVTRSRAELEASGWTLDLLLMQF